MTIRSSRDKVEMKEVNLQEMEIIKPIIKELSKRFLKN